MSVYNNFKLKNNEKWEVHAHFDEENCHLKVLDKWGTELQLPLFLIVEETPSIGHPLDHLKQRIQKLEQQKNPFGFQIYKKEDRCILVFGKYGIAGGGRTQGIVAGMLQAVAGAILQGTGAASLPGSLLLNAGLNSGLYSYSTSEENFETSAYVKSEVAGAVSGLISWGILLLNPGGYFIGKTVSWATSAINSAATQASTTVAHSLFNGELPIPKKVLIGAVAAAGGSCAESLVTHLSPIPASATGRIAQEIVTSLAQTATRTVLENSLEAKTWHERLKEACSLTLLLASLAATARELQRFLTLKRTLPLNQRIEDLEKEEDEVMEQLLKANRDELEIVKLQDKRREAQEQELHSLNQELAHIEQRLPTLNPDNDLSQDQLQELITLLDRNKYIHKRIFEIVADLKQINIFLENIAREKARVQKSTGVAEHAMEQIYRIRMQQMRLRLEMEDRVGMQINKLIEQGYSSNLTTRDLKTLLTHLAEGGVLVFSKPNQDPISIQIPEGIALTKELEGFLKQRAETLEDLKRSQRSAFYSFQELSRIVKNQIPHPPFAPRRIEKIPAPLFSFSPSTSVEFVDVEEWQELLEHIVLVHGISPNFLGGLLDSGAAEDYDYDRHADPQYRTLYALKKILTPEGRMGSHLDYSQKQFKGALVDRPHLHWACGELCQPNSGGNWEECEIVILESLQAFEENAISSLYGIAPYDTLTIGDHLLSDKSTLLIPNHTENVAREYLTGFKGHIVGYPEEPKITARARVFDILQTHYPQAWHLVDPKTGEKIAPVNHQNRSGYHFGSGYFEKTCFERGDGKRAIFITRSGERADQIHLTALKEAQAKGKFIGLHIHSVTFWLEDDQNASFKNLKNFKKNPATVKGNPTFAGFANEGSLSHLVILEALRFRAAVKEIQEENRIKEVGDYILFEALYADLAATFYAKYPDAQLDFTPRELELMLYTDKEGLLNTLEALFKNKNERSLQDYQAALSIRLEALLKARLQLQQFDAESIDIELPEAPLSENPLLLEKWENIESKQLNFDARWPLHPQERAFFVQLQQICERKELDSLRFELKRIADDDSLLSSYLKYGLCIIFKQILFERDYS